MKVLIQLAFCTTLFLGIAAAQHRGGGGGGGFRGSGGGASHVGGGGVGSLGHGGLVGGGGVSGFRGGFGGIGVRGGYGYRGIGFRGYGYPYYGYGYGYGYGLGLGFGYPYYGYGYPYYDYYDYPDSYPDASYGYQGGGYQGGYQGAYPAYQPSTTVVYPPAQPASYSYPERVTPVMHEYDQYGQQVNAGDGNESSSPIYLIALKSHNIYAASSYSINGATLNYVTVDHAEKQVPLSEIDRDMTLRLNRERHVAFQLPMQQ